MTMEKYMGKEEEREYLLRDLELLKTSDQKRRCGKGLHLMMCWNIYSLVMDMVMDLVLVLVWNKFFF
jgi:hypothetical protein